MTDSEFQLIHKLHGDNVALYDRIINLQAEFIVLQTKYYDDVKEFAHAYSKLAADLMNTTVNTRQPDNWDHIQPPELDDEGLPTSLTGGEIG